MPQSLTNNNITHDQRKKIFALSRQANISNEELHAYMLDWAKVYSLRDGSCNRIQANKIIDSLEKVVNIRKTPAKGSITERQLNAINSLKRILKWNDARIGGFMRHTVDKTDLQSLSVVEASRVITGLKNYLKFTTSKNEVSVL